MTDEKADSELPEGMAPLDDDFDEDAFLTSSLAGLDEVQVPANLVPSVMFRVYEKHHRDKVTLRFIVCTALVLLALCLGAFALDVHAFRQQTNAASFETALSAKTEALRTVVEQTAADLSGLVLALWQIVSGTVGALSWGVTLLILAGLVALLYALKLGLAGLMGR